MRQARIKAFTLVEILVVIAILAILAVITIAAINPAFRLREANNAQVRNSVRSIAHAIELYEVDNFGILPTADGSALPTVTTADLEENGVDANTLEGIEGSYLSSIPSQPVGIVYYVGVESSSGQPLVGAGIQQNDGSYNLFTSLYGESEIALVNGGGGVAEGGGGGGAASLIPTGQELIDASCGVHMSITNGSTYTKGLDYPNDSNLNIKFAFADESAIEKTVTRYRMLELNGDQVYTSELTDIDSGGGFFVKSDNCVAPVYAANSLGRLRYAGFQHTFEVTIYGTNGDTETYNFGYTLQASEGESFF